MSSVKDNACTWKSLNSMSRDELCGELKFFLDELHLQMVDGWGEADVRWTLRDISKILNKIWEVSR